MIHSPSSLDFISSLGSSFDISIDSGDRFAGNVPKLSAENSDDEVCTTESHDWLRTGRLTGRLEVSPLISTALLRS